MVGQGQVLVLIVILVIGIIFGAGVTWWLLGSRRSNAPEPEPTLPRDELATLRIAYTEQIGLWHEKKSGKLVVRFENQMLEQVGQLPSDQRTRMVALTKEWLAWLGVAQPAAPAQNAETAQPPILPVAQTSAAPVKSSPTSQRLAPISSPTSAAAASPSTPAKPKSIVEQIDEILQEKLLNSTSNNKGVRLMEDPLHGVVVWVGLEHFDGVDQVTDPEVRALLRESAEEWERRSGPTKR